MGTHAIVRMCGRERAIGGAATILTVVSALRHTESLPNIAMARPPATQLGSLSPRRVGPSERSLSHLDDPRLTARGLGSRSRYNSNRRSDIL
jgi:hypothetical protein